MTGADWDAVFSRIDLSKVDLSAIDAQAVIERLLDQVPPEQRKAIAKALHDAAARARTDREFLATAIRVVGSLVKFVA